MKVGIIQGRLSEPAEGYQDCPANWRREFDLLRQLRLNHIEWIVTKENYHSNPIHHVDLKNLPISSVCADFMVDDDFNQIEYLENYLKPICDLVRKNHIYYLTIPLLEKSSVVDYDVRDEFANAIYPYLCDYPDIKFLFEAELGIKELKGLVMENVGITYDTGNITSFQIDHEEYIESFKHDICQVHIKDRTINPMSTVVPGKGDTDFKTIFKKLKSINYDGLYTLQTARQEHGNEIETVKKHKEIIREFYNEKSV